MIQGVWILVVSTVALATGLFYSLAIGSMALFGLFAALLAVFAAVQWILLSRGGDRLRNADAETVLRDQ